MVLTGCRSLDRLLEGGLPVGAISLIYGEAETGKTSLAIQCAVGCARMGYKTIFIDSDGTFSPRRLSQIAYYDFEKISPLIVLGRPTTFEEQAHAIEHLDEYLTRNVRMVVVDTITSLYRVEIGTPRETFALNRELNRQIACLAQIAKTRGVATLLTSQVRGILAEGRVGVEPVATRVLKHWSNIVIQFKSTGRPRVVEVLLEKHPKYKRPRSCYVSIERTGIRDHGR